MSMKKTSQEEIGETIRKAQELGISYKETTERFGVPVWKIYH